MYYATSQSEVKYNDFRGVLGEMFAKGYPRSYWVYKFWHSLRRHGVEVDV